MTFERVDLSEDVTLYRGDNHVVLADLPEASVHCVVTSPPYYGLRSYLDTDDPNKPLEIGLEETPEEYVAKMVDVFREVRRVLRGDGTLWLNLGDSYASGEIGRHDSVQGREIDGKPVTSKAKVREQIALSTGVKPKNLIGIPWRVALALQADGWWLRQDIIWHKSNPMPESVTDRCTKAHEYVFLLTKSARYYYDNEAVKEGGSCRPKFDNNGGRAVADKTRNDIGLHNGEPAKTRNRRSVWTVATKPYSGAHFATFPPDLIEPMILAGCPAMCCPVCGKGWKRVVEKEFVKHPNGLGNGTETKDLQQHRRGKTSSFKTGGSMVSTTLGFRPSCDCGASYSVPGVVLDPFGGSGTTAEIAVKHGRKAVLIDLNADYMELQKERLFSVVAQPHLFTPGAMLPGQPPAPQPQQAALFEDGAA